MRCRPAEAKETTQWKDVNHCGALCCVVAEAGLERTANSSGNTGHSEKGGAESGASCGDSRPIDPDLMAVIAAWPDLPETVRQSIMAAVRAASVGGLK
jgi:hypothetical protein